MIGLRKRLLGILSAWLFLVGSLIATCASCATPQQVRQMQEQQRFSAAMRDVGGSVAKPLVERLDRIKDGEVAQGDPELRVLLLKRIAGQIGSLKIKNTSMGVMVEPPAKFRAGFEELHSLARAGHLGACQEVGALIFVDAVKGSIGISERVGVAFLKKAVKSRNPDALYLYAFCLYYGIGGAANRKQAIGLLKERDDLLQANSKRKANRQQQEADKSWALRRLQAAGAVELK